MNQQQAMALAMYVNRAMGIMPTTGMEWNALSGALATVQAIANGQITMEVKPVEAPPEPEPEAPAKPETPEPAEPEAS